MVAAADSALKIETGKDTGGHIFALFDSAKPDTEIAAADAAKAGTKADDATEPAAEASEPSASRESEKADAPTLVPPTAATATASEDDAAIPAAHPVASAVPRSAFVLANSARHTQGHGIGGAFVPFETRSTIAPPSLFTSASFGGFATPAETAAPKRADKAAAPAVPDLKSLAANPEQMKKLRVNGMRPVPTAKPVPLESRAFPAGPQLPPLTGGNSPIAPVGEGLDGGNGDGFADLMARNIERYMSLKNKRPAPSHINQSF
jgi:hypothetical protein